MNGIFTVIDIVGVIFEILIALGFFECVSNKKYNTTVKTGILILVQSMAVVFVKQQIIVTVILYLVLICLSIQYELSVMKRIIYCIFLLVMYSLSEVLVGIFLSNVTNIGLEKLCSNVMYYTQGVLISKMLVFVIVKAISYTSVKDTVSIDKKVLVFLMALPASTIFIVFAMSDILYISTPDEIYEVLEVAIILLIISNIFVFYMLEYQLKITEEKNQQEIIKQSLENKAIYYEELSKRQIITNKAMHDMKNKLFALRQMCRENEKESIDIIDGLCEEIGSAYTLRFTGMEAVDALITTKLLVMKENNIEFSNSIFITKENVIKVMDLCVLLGNLLDNAIEANVNANISRKYISLKIQQQKNYLSIDISNSKDDKTGDIDMDNITTTKKDKEMHGFGLKSVKEIVEKYDGNISVKQIGDRFEVTILMKNIKG